MCSFHSGYISLVQPTESSTKSLVVTRYGGFYGHRLQYFMMKRPTSEKDNFEFQQNNSHEITSSALTKDRSHPHNLIISAPKSKTNKIKLLIKITKPRPTWLPDGRSWVNSSSMSELGSVCRRLTYLAGCCTR
jgi:hypothetical protein